MRSGAGSGRTKIFLTAAGVLTLTVMVVGALMAPRLLAQSSAQSPTGQSAPTGDRPAFDVVSIKANKSGAGMINVGGSLAQPGGLYRATNVPLRLLITFSYKLNPHLLIEAPEWDHLLSERFDIEAWADGNPGMDDKLLMIQSLLADRFKLVMHKEKRQMPFYALVASKPGKVGPKLTAHSDDLKCLDMGGPPPAFPAPGAPLPAFCGGFIVYVKPGDAHATGNNVTMDMLVSQLSGFVDRPILDHTGLSGKFDVDLEFIPLQGPGALAAGSNAASTDASAPPELFTAIQEQLGLKLEPQNGPVDVLVIDHVEEPSEN